MESKHETKKGNQGSASKKGTAYRKEDEVSNTKGKVSHVPQKKGNVSKKGVVADEPDVPQANDPMTPYLKLNGGYYQKAHKREHSKASHTEFARGSGLDFSRERCLKRARSIAWLATKRWESHVQE